MALRIVNADSPLPPALGTLAASLPQGAPVVVMVHGYRFSPVSPAHDPHRHILSLSPSEDARRAVPWPRALGFTQDGNEGLAVAFGWESRGSLRAAYGSAAMAGAELAGLIDRLALAARRPVSVIGHSLGARVALAALPRVAPGAAGRIVLLAAAEFRDRAAAAAASPAGMLAEIVNVTSRENDPFDFALELMLRGGRARALGHGLGHARRNWTDIQLDHGETLAGLRRLGFPIATRAARACHWSPYLREGVFPLYRAILDGRLALATLAHALPERHTPRWSRLIGLRGGGDAQPSLLGSA